VSEQQKYAIVVNVPFLQGTESRQVYIDDNARYVACYVMAALEAAELSPVGIESLWWRTLAALSPEYGGIPAHRRFRIVLGVKASGGIVTKGQIEDMARAKLAAHMEHFPVEATATWDEEPWIE
jgi:hypothetical protein